MRPGLSTRVLGMRIDPVPVEEAGRLVVEWAAERSAHMVCAANVHMVMESWDDPEFRGLLDGADLVLADGRPVWWTCRAQGLKTAEHVRGYDLTLHLCALAAERGLPIAFLGGSPGVLENLQASLKQRNPDLRIAYAWSPPFRELTAAEEAAAIAEVNASGARLCFVGLGCPRQERFMARHRADAECVMLGVGAVFDWLGGKQAPAPRWVQRLALEWLYRLGREPRRLWRRYAHHNARFVVLVAVGLLTGRFARGLPATRGHWPR